MARSLVKVYLKETINDLFHAKHIPVNYRIWSIYHGMNPTAAWFKRINRNNVHEYLSDYSYCSNAPYNAPDCVWGVGKDRFRNTFKSFGEFLPIYYAELQGGKAIPLDGWNDQANETNMESILHLLEEKRRLAIKLIRGRAGVGFIEACCNGKDKFKFNDHEYTRSEAMNYLETLSGYLVSEYIEQCKQYQEIWNGTASTLRIQTCCLQGNVKPVFAFLRFGSSRAPYAVSHVASAGIYTANIDIETGHTNGVVTYDERGQYINVDVHSDTGSNMQIDVPHWDYIVGKCVEMHQYVPMLSWLGWDVIVTNDGFKVLEINTFSGLVGVEVFEPIHSSKKYEQIFNELMGLHNNWK